MGQPELYVRCRRGELDIFIAWNTEVSLRVTYHFDQRHEDRLTFNWIPSATTGAETTFHPNPERMFPELLQATTVSLTSREELAVSGYGATFRLHGLRETLAATRWDCGLDATTGATQGSTPTPRPTATPTVAPNTQLTAAQVFAAISPSIALIRTERGFAGSGILTERGYVVTNAHVVWPYEGADVVFPDGSQYDAPVVAMDPLVDLAVLGPVAAKAPRLELVDGEDLPVGTELFLVGYPGETEEQASPSLTRGLLSRYREHLGVTWLQADAIIAGGQSGGALVSPQGDVVGLSGFAFSEASFALASSAADLRPLVQRLIRGEDTSGLGERAPLGYGGGAHTHTDLLQNWWDQAAYIFDAAAGSIVDFTVAAHGGDPWFTVVDAEGQWFMADEDEGSTEKRDVAIGWSIPHYLVARGGSLSAVDITVTSTRPLTPVYDPDGGALRVGDTIRGNIDFPWDADTFHVQLRQGEVVEITARSILADTFIQIDYEGAKTVIADDDGGGGLFGTDARVVYRAPAAGTYLIVVENLYFSAPAGYEVIVEPAPAGATPTITTWEDFF